MLYGRALSTRGRPRRPAIAVHPQPLPARTQVDDADAAAIEYVENHNGEWFNNSLVSQKIRQYFQPSISMQGSLALTTQQVLLPEELVVGQKVTADLVCTGVVLYPRSFSLRWKLRSAAGLVAVSEEEDEDIGPTHEDKVDILAHTQADAAAVLKQVDAEAALLEVRLGRVRAYHDRVTTALAAANADDEDEAAWNRALEQVEQALAAWKTGELCVQSP